MQVGNCLTRSSKQQRLKYLSTDNDSVLVKIIKYLLRAELNIGPEF